MSNTLNNLDTQHQPNLGSKSMVIMPLYVRINHWLNALAVFVMILSGLRIYNASPIYDFVIPKGITLGGWLGGALLWHFAAMWFLVINACIYLLLNVGTRRLFRKFWPISIKELLSDLRSTLKGNLSHEDLSHYNAIQKLAYVFAIVDIFVLVVSGMVIWKSVQYPVLRDLLGGFDAAREIHFIAMSLLVAFIVVHIVMVALVPKTLRVMILGR